MLVLWVMRQSKAGTCACGGAPSPVVGAVCAPMGTHWGCQPGSFQWATSMGCSLCLLVVWILSMGTKAGEDTSETSPKAELAQLVLQGS